MRGEAGTGGKIPDEILDYYRRAVANAPRVPPCTCLFTDPPEMGRDPLCKSHNPEERAKWARENATPSGAPNT